MALRVGQGELTVSQAAREYGVSRNTVRLWVARAAADSAARMCERSRRPHRIPRATDEELAQRILDMKARRPIWGAKKIVAKLWPEDPPLSVRTADRILSRHGLVGARSQPRPEIRFERSQPNELLQVDFKGLGRPRLGYSPLSVLDDATRFCLALRPLPDIRSATIFSALWDVFGEYGLPEAVLTDNASCFADVSCRGPSWFEAQLWLLGIRVLHGRPLHPQTQGKVERFHGTIERELGPLARQQDIREAERVYARFVHDYNYERPHEALDMRAPGKLYMASPRKRPARMPRHEPAPGAVLRQVQVNGRFVFHCKRYAAGKGLSGEQVELREEQDGHGVYFANRRFAALDDLKG